MHQAEEYESELRTHQGQETDLFVGIGILLAAQERNATERTARRSEGYGAGHLGRRLNGGVSFKGKQPDLTLGRGLLLRRKLARIPR